MRRQNVSLSFIITLALLGALLFMLVQWLLTGIPPVSGQEPAPVWNVTGPGQRYTETIPVYDVRDLGYQPIRVPAGNSSLIPQSSVLQWGGGSNPANPYAVIRLNGAPEAHPGATARYEITLANYESVTHTYQLTNTLPPQLVYVPGSADGLTYHPPTRTLTWQGELAPGRLEYVIEASSLSLPYLDLADFGAVNLCYEFIANGETCDDVTVTFNLGVNGYTASLYGQLLSQLTVSANGLVLGEATAASGHNQWLPDTAEPNYLLAGLWRDVDMTTTGRWHAAILTGLLEGHDVFYAQWHDAPHANDPDLTARHAIAVVLNGSGGLDGQAFFLYDNISDPAQTAANGYTIGIEDKLGLRGTTYAYAPCCGDPQPPQGFPPAAGITLHLRPVLFGADSAYHRTFGYDVSVNGQVPETIANTAVAGSSSADPALSQVWASHYLAVRWQAFLPVAMRTED
jgi:uncharacterized repeat protein (TIGR01451 family)